MPAAAAASGGSPAARLRTSSIWKSSSNEPIYAIEVIRLGVNWPSFAAYALTDLLAEKFRALLQQVARNPHRQQRVYRRQDVDTSPIWRRDSRQTMMSGLRYSNPSATSAGRAGSHRRPKLRAILGSRSARRPNGIPSGKKLASYRTSMRASPKSRRSTVRCPGQVKHLSETGQTTMTNPFQTRRAHHW